MQAQVTAEPPAALLRRRALLTGLAGAGAALAAVAKGGPLNPPAGPITSTGKTLLEIEPRTAVTATNTPGDATAVFVISQPGSYHLVGNIAVPAGRIGIRIAASRVTLDLRGFRIDANLAAGTAGITDGGAAQTAITVRNGTVTRTAGTGISLSMTQAAVVENMVVHTTQGVGVHAGSGARITRVLCSGCATSNPALAAGIRTGDHSVISSCTLRGNTGPGIAANLGCVIESCLSTDNTGSGMSLLSSGAVLQSLAALNGNRGISGASLVKSSSASDNDSRGIEVASAGSIEGCIARGNKGHGIANGNGGSVTECAASLSVGTAGVAHGFSMLAGTITRCAAYSNASNGINVESGGNVRSCVARRNTLDGIVSTFGSSHITGNTSSDNGTLAVGAGAGVRVDGSNCRIESNLCTGNSSYGVYAAAPANMVVRNACSLNQINWSIFSNCAYGPVINRTSISVSGMSGNGTVASTVGTEDAHANLSF